MFFIVEVINIKDNKKYEDLKFSSNEYKVRILDMDENEYFSSDKIIEESKNENQEANEEINENKDL
jgi:hypothetical protein